MNKGNLFGKKTISQIFHKLFGIDLSKYYFNQENYLFRGYSKWRQIKQWASRLNWCLLTNFECLVITNHVKFTEEYVIAIK